ncbi:MAG TPA: helix-turn-helix domain-containing protein [Burkholderiaceae bacterium]|jgi:AraC family transcriptional activator of pobA|nr:helix-turn-helix domain-containing protein [Burkholderiaceae bacterium]
MAQMKDIPVFKLYGEREQWPTPDMVHCESIAARSELHNWQIEPHQHNGLFQVLYLKGGTAEVQLDDTRQEMGSGQILMVPQMCIHSFQFSRCAVGSVATIAYPLLKRLTQQAGDGLVALTSPRLHILGNDEESRHIDLAFDALENEYKGNAPYRNLLVESVLGTILLLLARRSLHCPPNASHSAGKAGEHFSKFCQLIEDNYAGHRSLSYYAHEIGITAAYLNALCRRTVGKSALDLVHERMVLEAKRHLVYTSMTISVVSYALGFSDPAYFTRFFKRQVGVSPKGFRRQAGT